MKPSKALFTLSMLAYAFAEQEPCTLRHCGTFVDLNPLSSEKDYIFQSYTGRNITLNVCKSVTSEAWNPRVDDTKTIGGFTRGAHGDISLGETNTTLHSRDGQPVIIMTNGSPCENDSERRASSVVRFICDKSVETGLPHLVAQLPPEDEDACTFFIEWRTRYACSTKVGSNTTLVVVVLAATIILLLAALFIVYRRLFRRSSSSSSLPLPSYAPSPGIRGRFRDFTRFILRRDPWGDPADGLGLPNGNGHAAPTPGARKSWFPWRRSARRSRAGFSRLAGSPEEEAMMGRDDDSDDEHERQGNGRTSGGVYGEEGNLNTNAVWEESRPTGIDGSGVIRL